MLELVQTPTANLPSMSLNETQELQKAKAKCVRIYVVKGPDPRHAVGVAKEQPVLEGYPRNTRAKLWKPLHT